jgi:hypothetical protein
MVKYYENLQEEEFMCNKKISIIILVALLTTIFPLQVFAVEEIADSVYLNGNIYTVDEEYSKAEAIAIKGQYLLHVGILQVNGK